MGTRQCRPRARRIYAAAKKQEASRKRKLAADFREWKKIRRKMKKKMQNDNDEQLPRDVDEVLSVISNRQAIYRNASTVKGSDLGGIAE